MKEVTNWDCEKQKKEKRKSIPALNGGGNLSGFCAMDSMNIEVTVNDWWSGGGARLRYHCWVRCARDVQQTSWPSADLLDQCTEQDREQEIQ